MKGASKMQRCHICTAKVNYGQESFSVLSDTNLEEITLLCEDCTRLVNDFIFTEAEKRGNA